MRAFVAIDLPGTLRAALARAQQTFGALCPDARWTRPEGIHLTLKFIGNISDAQTKQVVEALESLERFAPFPVEVKGFGFFPNAKRPRVFWAGVIAPPALAELADRVERRLEKIGFPREDRTYSPHLTLARFQVPRSQTALSATIAQHSTISLGQFEVSDFFLFESKLSPRGAQYRQVVQFPKGSG